VEGREFRAQDSAKKAGESLIEGRGIGSRKAFFFTFLFVRKLPFVLLRKGVKRREIEGQGRSFFLGCFPKSRFLQRGSKERKSSSKNEQDVFVNHVVMMGESDSLRPASAKKRKGGRSGV